MNQFKSSQIEPEIRQALTILNRMSMVNDFEPSTQIMSRQVREDIERVRLKLQTILQKVERIHDGSKGIAPGKMNLPIQANSFSLD
ncbi:MAG: hypothetical protein AAF939_21795 [Planctomycetota bacterium]